MTIEPSTPTLSGRLRWSIVMGVLTAVLGVVMIVYSSITAVVSAVFLGWTFVFAAVAQFVFAFSSESAGNFFLKILVSLLYGIAGVALLVFPLAGVLTLTGVIGIMFIADAAIEIGLAFALPAFANRAWLLVNAAASLLLGVLILAHWPSSAAWAIGTMAGAAVLINGITRVVLSSTVLHDLQASKPMTPTHA